VPLPRCNFGCFIFASTMGNQQPSDDGMDPYIKNLLINDQVKDRNQSIAELATKFQPGTSQKIPYEISANGQYSILNLNAPDVVTDGSDVTVWIIELTRASFFDYEIYDAVAMDRIPTFPSAVVTIMSAARFSVYAEPGEPNSYTARLVGFDNAFDDNAPDLCTHAYKTPVNSNFEGFEFQVNGPIISLVFAKRTNVNLKADSKYFNGLSMSTSGFLTSPGFNGCERLGGNQV
ncbi:hypothetical protein PENTCL1PPCAC_20681, partial [Pristionchus entomophagus]